MSDNQEHVAPLPQGTSGYVWRHFGRQLGSGGVRVWCYCYLLFSDQDCCETFYNAQHNPEQERIVYSEIAVGQTRACRRSLEGSAGIKMHDPRLGMCTIVSVIKGRHGLKEGTLNICHPESSDTR